MRRVTSSSDLSHCHTISLAQFWPLRRAIAAIEKHQKELASVPPSTSTAPQEKAAGECLLAAKSCIYRTGIFCFIKNMYKYIYMYTSLSLSLLNKFIKEI